MAKGLDKTDPVIDTRRRQLRLYIDNYCGGRLINFIELTDINQGELSGLLNGTRPFGEGKARKLERMLNLPHGWFDLATYQNQDFPLPETNLIKNTPEEDRLLDFFRNCIPARQAEILSLAIKYGEEYQQYKDHLQKQSQNQKIKKKLLSLTSATASSAATVNTNIVAFQKKNFIHRGPQRRMRKTILFAGQEKRKNPDRRDSPTPCPTYQ